MTQETILSIAKWSEETFGDNITLEGQFEKFLDERQEWIKSDFKDIMELADLIIVASSMARFSLVDAALCFAYVDAELKLSKFTVQDLEKAINKKMQINRKREWNKIGNKFQHIEEGSEE